MSRINKWVFVTLLAFSFSISTVFGQNDAMYVLKSGELVGKYNKSDFDSIIFYKPTAPIDTFTSITRLQTYLDKCYTLIMDPNHNGLLVVSNNIGTESVSTTTASPASNGVSLNYPYLSDVGRSVFIGFGATTIDNSGIWQWWPMGCRIANVSLSNLNKLNSPTQQDKDLLTGQALFFRAYLNFEVARAYGSVPYLDHAYPNLELFDARFYTDLQSGKKDFQALAEKATRDLTEAAQLLPTTWDTPNIYRITKGAALALKSKVLLYSGSPLFEESSNLGAGMVTPDETAYNINYMTRAAEAAAEVIQLNLYTLTPFVGDAAQESYSPGAGYRKMFCNIDGSVPYTNEIIFKRSNPTTMTGKTLFDNRFGRIYAKHATLGGAAGGCETPLLRFMDKFEMSDGTAYKSGNTVDGGYDDNITKFQEQRDPRFNYNFRLHNERIGNYAPNFVNQGKYEDPSAIAPFLITKYWLPLADKQNAVWGNFNYGTPGIRYAEVLLFYAEAVFEATGNPDASIGTTLTAREALNLVRNRVGMPNYNPATYAVARTTHGELTTDAPFRLAVRNERCVELAYEGHLWFDYRRWKRSHLLDKQIWILDFKTDAATKSTFTSANRVVLQPYLFEMKHYWLPFRKSTILNNYPFEQNMGW